MSARKAIGLLLLSGVAFAIWKRKRIGGMVMSYGYSDAEALGNANVQKAEALIKRYESKGQYNILYGNGHFASYAEHPNVKIPFIEKLTGKPNFSTAAGAYQINHPTWLTVQASRIARGAGKLPDFTPASQDLAFIEILRIDGTLDSIIKADWQNALVGLSKRWASMPLDKTGQSKLAMADAIKQLTA